MLFPIPRLLTLILWTLCLGACDWNSTPPSDTLVFGLSSEPRTLDPRWATDADSQRLAHLIFSSLIQKDQKLQDRGDLALDWNYKNKTYTFRLKPGIRFHDGTPATEEDFVFSVNEFRKKSFPFYSQFKVIERVEAKYDMTSGGWLKLSLKHFTSSFLSDLPVLKLLPKKKLEQWGEDFFKKPIGTGPFQLKDHKTKDLFLSRFPDFFDKPAKTKHLHFKIVQDSTTRFQKLYKGEIDIVQSEIPLSKVPFFQKQPHFEVITSDGLSTTYILLNLRNPNLSKKEFRRAISSAIDRKQMITYSHQGYGDIATALLTKAHPNHNHDLQYETLGKEQIQALFSQVNGRPLILKTSNGRQAIENGKVITHQLKSQGLPIEQRSFEWATFYQDVRTGNFDMAIMKWVGITDPDLYRISLHSQMIPPGRNRGYYSNPQLDRLSEKAFQEPDKKKRQELYHRIQRVVFEDLPTIPLWYEKQVAIVHKRVKNYTLPTNGDFSSLTRAYKDDDKRE